MPSLPSTTVIVLFLCLSVATSCDRGDNARDQARSFADQACRCTAKECVEGVLVKTAQWLVREKKKEAEVSPENRQAVTSSLRKLRDCSAKYQVNLGVFTEIVEPVMNPPGEPK